ncbi:hypothetical protein [Rhizobium anhuiense]|uniref:hypothetical protein n=1 Tax=Rhizobium anhuiense TaxID=1184720 RepID=UPI0015CF2621|nr:hypothetical protein [Rhizobium anhuiense]
MSTNVARQDSSTSKERGDELRTIMKNAVHNTLLRPETLRGPYIIRDIDLKTGKPGSR